MLHVEWLHNVQQHMQTGWQGSCQETLRSCAPPICQASMLPVHMYVAFPLPQVMDYGYPQFTEAQILQEFIKTDSYRMEVS